jgi:hypothetical protein
MSLQSLRASYSRFFPGKEQTDVSLSQTRILSTLDRPVQDCKYDSTVVRWCLNFLWARVNISNSGAAQVTDVQNCKGHQSIFPASNPPFSFFPRFVVTLAPVIIALFVFEGEGTAHL